MTVRTFFGAVALVALSANIVTADLTKKYLTICDLAAGTTLGAETAPEYAHLPGVYDGKWSNALSSALVIVDVNAEGKVRAYYAHDRYFEWNIDRAGCRDWIGTLEESTIRFKGRRATVIYEVAESGELEGTFSTDRFTNRGTFTRVTNHPWRQ